MALDQELTLAFENFIIFLHYGKHKLDKIRRGPDNNIINLNLNTVEAQISHKMIINLYIHIKNRLNLTSARIATIFTYNCMLLKFLSSKNNRVWNIERFLLIKLKKLEASLIFCA